MSNLPDMPKEVVTPNEPRITVEKSSVAAEAVAQTVFATASGFVAPPVAIAYAIGASTTIVLGSHFVTSYANEVTHSVLNPAINSLSERQKALESSIYEYSRTPFAGGF